MIINSNINIRFQSSNDIHRSRPCITTHYSTDCDQWDRVHYKVTVIHLKIPMSQVF
jgi:hypothetical protein